MTTSIPTEDHEDVLPPVMVASGGTPEPRDVPATAEGRIDSSKLTSDQALAMAIARNRALITQPSMVANIRAEARRLLDQGIPLDGIVVGVWAKVHPLVGHFGFVIPDGFGALVSATSRAVLARELAGADEKLGITAHIKLVRELLAPEPEPAEVLVACSYPAKVLVACFYDGSMMARIALEPPPKAAAPPLTRPTPEPTDADA